MDLGRYILGDFRIALKSPPLTIRHKIVNFLIDTNGNLVFLVTDNGAIINYSAVAFMTRIENSENQTDSV